MAAQLDILALEPFFGGVRKHMLETVIRCSRHRWTLLKLPPRRIERRLTAAAHWFAEQLSRHWVGRVDLVFASDALNLSDLCRLVPALARKPSVVYFHNNQLPATGVGSASNLDFVNLNTATAATEIWFNSLYHLKTFLARASSMVERHAELATHSPMRELAGKAHLMTPPLDMSLVHSLLSSGTIRRDKRTIFVETRDADVRLLEATCDTLARRGETYKLITVGPVGDLSPDVPRKTIAENDDEGQIKALMEAGVMISTKRGAPCDHHAVRALTAGCWPVFPYNGVYPELIPESLHSTCLHDGTPDMIASRLQDVWHLSRPDGYDAELSQILHQFDAIRACNAIDDRLEELAVSNSLRR